MVSTKDFDSFSIGSNPVRTANVRRVSEFTPWVTGEVLLERLGRVSLKEEVSADT